MKLYKFLDKKFLEQILLIGFGTILTLVTTLLTGWQSNERIHEEWRRNQISTVTHDILKRRLEILEKTTRYLNKNGLFEIYEMQNNWHRERMAITAKSDVTQEEFQEQINSLTENYKNYTDLHSEIATTLSLAKFYFGPKTKNAVEVLVSSSTDSTSYWFKKNPQLFNNVLSAMEQEIAHEVDFSFNVED